MEKIISDSERSRFFNNELRDYFKVIVTSNVLGDEWKTQYPQYQLAVKTYDSDIYQNWVNTDWIDGSNGINEITAVNVADGKLTMDALNLAQKVYNMLNRIAISGGTYRDWLETVYTTGSNYFERCETPNSKVEQVKKSYSKKLSVTLLQKTNH